MKKFMGTPGPWTVSAGDWDENKDARYSLKDIKEVSFADARLIAAAPDMFDVCRQIVSSVEGKDDVEFKNAYYAAKAVISKTTGPSHG